MKIGLFTNSYHPFISGVVNSLDGIRRGLQQRGHTPFVFAPEVRGHSEEHAGVFRFPSVAMSRRVEFPIPIPYSAKLFRLLRKMELDLIHAHHPFLLGDVAANFARKKRVPLVYTFHTQLEQYSHYIPLNQEMVKGVARSRISGFARKCDLIIAPSPSIRQLLDSYGITTRVVTLPNAIETERFSLPQEREVWRQRLELPQDAVVALAVGRLGREKNLDFLLRAFARVEPSQQHPRYLVLVGDGTEREQLVGLSQRLGIADRVRFPGSIPYTEMPSVYAACDLFTICSTTEVKPLVVLEAMASGLPCLAVAACGTADTLHHGEDGWLCRCDLQAYLEGWERLAGDGDLREKLGARARLTARDYSIDSYLSRLLELYQETIQASAMGAAG